MSTHSLISDNAGDTLTEKDEIGMSEYDHPLQRIRKLMEKYPQLSSTKKIVLVTLSTFADRLGMAWPARKRLIMLTGLKERSLRYAVRDLEAASIISTILPYEGRAFSYHHPDGPVYGVPDGVCIYFVWPFIHCHAVPVARALARPWLERQAKRVRPQRPAGSKLEKR
jgi:hypothetical protein